MVGERNVRNEILPMKMDYFSFEPLPEHFQSAHIFLNAMQNFELVSSIRIARNGQRQHNLSQFHNIFWEAVFEI